jgi:hypothetical protein
MPHKNELSVIRFGKHINRIFFWNDAVINFNILHKVIFVLNNFGKPVVYATWILGDRYHLHHPGKKGM